ncbi:MAG: amylo-alpha-1,6-glucosidase, partial [Bryobacteraceae bacterium]
PTWIYKVHNVTLEKRLLMIHKQNTVHINYRLYGDDCDVRLELRPALNFRPHEGAVGMQLDEPYVVSIVDSRFEFSSGDADTPALRALIHGRDAAFTYQPHYVQEILYRIEESRGYEARGDLWSPGYFHVTLCNGDQATLVTSTEQWESIFAIKPEDVFRVERERLRKLIAIAGDNAKEDVAAELVIAADQFVITPAGRIEDVARAGATGDDVRTVLAGYHWFTDWGRDTMISLEGLTLTTGRHSEAGWILRTFAHYIREGLIPNMFPEGENEGLYHTADATLWFFHAMDRYLAVTNDRVTLELVLPKLAAIVRHHVEGTHFNIGVDPADGLLRQGAEGYQLTWMDAKVEDWVVTPRRGKAVEVNALWYNALQLLAHWAREESYTEVDHSEIADHAHRAKESFNRRFWHDEGGYLYDVVDGEQGDDPACRPNQLLAISPRFAILEQSRWASVIDVCRDRLMTPVGLRSLAPGHNDYKEKYYGDLRARDAAYHQGTVWAWLIGPFIDAWLKVYPEDKAGARRFLEGFREHLGEACIGSISEIFDAEKPYTPRGCIAQAWSVAELLRCWAKTAH